MIKTIIFFLSLLLSVVFLLSTLINTGILLYKKTKNIEYRQVKNKQLKSLIIAVVFIASSIACIIITQLNVHTPTIGNTSANPISELIEVNINGKEEWISIRGKDIDNPILLFLAGGPGGTQLGAVRRNLAALEDNFVVVNWEQAGSGKSYNVMPTKDITIDTYINDGILLTEYLRERFSKDKIYLMGESWGSALGIFMVDKQPEYYYAFIGTGQMVAFEETEIVCYELALQLAEKRGDSKKITALLNNGIPPYYGNDVALKSAEYLNYLSNEMAHNTNIHNAGYDTFTDLSSPEYGVLDQINFIRGVMVTYSSVYPQLYDVDLRDNYSILEVPVYFFIGRYDINAPTQLAEDFYNILKAPDKKLIWFENSGHSPWINESKLFCQKTNELFTQHIN